MWISSFVLSVAFTVFNIYHLERSSISSDSAAIKANIQNSRSTNKLFFDVLFRKVIWLSIILCMIIKHERITTANEQLLREDIQPSIIIFKWQCDCLALFGKKERRQRMFLLTKVIVKYVVPNELLKMIDRNWSNIFLLPVKFSISLYIVFLYTFIGKKIYKIFEKIRMNTHWISAVRCLNMSSKFS